MIALAPYILILMFANGDVKVVQDLNRQTCYTARDVIRTASDTFQPPERRILVAVCLNTLDPEGTP